MNLVAVAVTTVLTGAAIAFCLRAERKVPRIEGDVIVLRYAAWMRWVMRGGAILCLAGWGVALWLALAPGATEQNVRTAALATIVAVVMSVGGFCEPRVCLEMDAAGIRGQTAFRGRRAIAWADIVAVDFGQKSASWVLRDRTGQVLRVPRYLVGSEAVLAALEAHVDQRIWKGAAETWRRVRGG